MKETLSTQVLFGVQYALVDVTRLYRGPFKEGYRQFINLKKGKKGLEFSERKSCRQLIKTCFLNVESQTSERKFARRELFNLMCSFFDKGRPEAMSFSLICIVIVSMSFLFLSSKKKCKTNPA